MENLIAYMTDEGVELVKQELYDGIKKFSLVDVDDAVYYTADVHSVYFDTEGILTASIVIPKEDDFSSLNRKIFLLNEDDDVVFIVETAMIQFIKGIGGIQEVKITVSGEPATLVFKNDDYTTDAEFEIFKSQFDNYLTKEELTQAMEEFYEKCLTTDDVGTKVLAPNGDARSLKNLPSNTVLFGGF